MTSDERNPPKSATDILTYLSKPEKHSVSGNGTCLIESYAAYMVYGVTKENMIPAKHFLLALGLHNITGKQMVVGINKKLGYCKNYNTTREMETTQAMRAQQLAAKSSIFSIITNSDKIIVLPYFWEDKFDHIVDHQARSGPINTMDLVVYLEKNDNCHYESNLPTIQRKKRKTVDEAVNEMVVGNIKTNVEPPLINTEAVI